MKNMRVLLFVILALMMLGGMVFAAPAKTTINVVCLFGDFPANARITLQELDTYGKRVPNSGVVKDTSSGFFSFKVDRHKSYRVDATKTIATGSYGISSPMAGQEIKNIDSAVVIGLVLKSAF